MSKNTLKVPCKGAPIHVTPTGSLWKEIHHLQSQWFTLSFIFLGVPKKEPFQKMRGKHTVTVHGAPRRQKAYIQ
jgi:hypothetical protein